MIERQDACNWSTLRAMRASPKHYRYLLEHPQPDTEAFLQGRLVHAMTYEADAVLSRYARAPRVNRSMNDDTAQAKGYDGGKQMAAQFDAECAARSIEVVPADMWERALAMCAALRADPHASAMIVGGYAEQLVSWTHKCDDGTVIECRGRIDHVNGRLSDLKTTRTIEPRAFAASAVRLGYHAQISFYHDGLLANGVVLSDPPAIIAVENEAPFDVAVYEFTEQDIDAGRRVYRACLDRLAECRATDSWPGVSGGVKQRIALPEWSLPEMELTMGGIALDV